jgi:putative membrane protein
MKTLINILFTTVFVLLIAYFMPGVTVDGFGTALIVALVLGLLNIFIKPILVLFTLPVTIITLGLFLLVINAIIILICDELVNGFDVRSFLSALLFSLILSLCQSVVSRLVGK